MSINFTWNILGQQDYEVNRLPFIAAAEGYELLPYLDTAATPIPTIGIGFNLLDTILQPLSIKKIFYPNSSDIETQSYIGQDSTYADQIITALNQSK